MTDTAEPASTAEHATTLALSRREAAASALTTATSDNFLNAFAVYLNASALQLGTLAAIPQLTGAIFQFAALPLDRIASRRKIVVAGSAIQAAAIVSIAALALGVLPASMLLLMIFAATNQAALNFAQPHWRAWLGRLVSARERGSFFASRSRMVMLMSLLVFVLGGTMLSLSARWSTAGAGFALLFAIAAAGRAISAQSIARMRDPDVGSPVAPHVQGTLRRVAEAFRDPGFRNYTLFVAGLQGAVAVTAPFFVAYMLRDLHYTYLMFAINSVTSIAMQFAMMRAWGRIGDRYGNLWIMRITASLITVVPLLWIITPNYYFLLFVQVIAGFAWSGFSLSAGNYLYDIRPHHTNFAVYAAVQAAIAAILVCGGALLGGWAAQHVGTLMATLPAPLASATPIFAVFVLGSLLRVAVVAAYVPRMSEPHGPARPKVMEVVFRISQINAISGVVLDWLTITRRGRK